MYFGMDCLGNETCLSECETYKRKDCLHIHDAGVVCYPRELLLHVMYMPWDAAVRIIKMIVHLSYL